MKSLLISTGSIMLTFGVLANAYYQKKQFYPSVVYITKSSPSMAVLYVQAFVCVILFGKMLRKIFFGQLRAAEMEHLIERSWYAVTETCLAFTVFRDDFSPRFVALFTMLLFLKCFHWLAEDRVDYMERSPIITFRFHLRALALLISLGLLDVYFVQHAYYSTLLKGASVQLVFGFEYAILLTVVVHTFVKYVLHTIDLQNENPWESKTVYLLYTELLLGFLKVVLYVLFLCIMIKVHTFPLFAIRPMYLALRTFKKAMNDVIMSRRAIRNMNTLYPDATPEELAAGDNVCIICREEMTEGCKKLPCNHIFHTSCLRSWFQRQQTCPTCRMDILRPQPQRPPIIPQANVQPAAAQPQPPPAFPGFPFPMWPQDGQAAQPPQPGAAASEASSTATTPASTATATSSAGAAIWPPFMMPPMFMPPMPFNVPPPMPDTNFTGMSEEELRNMEGHERQNLEARIQCLRNIHTLLDAAMVQIQQYTSVVQNLGIQFSNPFGAAGAGGFTAQMFSTAATSTTDSVQSPRTSVTAADLSSPEGTSTNQSPPASTTAGSASSTAGSGARAKHPTTPSPALSHTEDNSHNLKAESLEGAMGYTPPLSEVPPGLLEDDTEEMNEVRRRRLERFSSDNLKSLDENDLSKSSGKNLDSD